MVLFAGFVLIVAVINLLLTSGSAQWALMAPVVIPMMMYVGVSPEVTQMLFRIGDSPTNIITPMSPYSMAMVTGRFIFFLIWYFLGIPLGPGAPLHFEL